MPDPKTPLNPSVCIIGAGAAGLSAAYFLKERGYTNVIVLEKENRIGGKCLSLTVDGKSFDLGANYITSAYKNVMRFARKFGATMYTEGKLNAYDHDANKFISLFKAVLKSSKISFLKLGWLSIKYVFIRWKLSSIISTKRPGYKNISDHKDLCQPFEDWLESKGLKPLEPLFRIPISLMGYGQLSQIPAAYALTYMSNPTFIDLALAAISPHIIGYPKRFTEGYQRLLDRISWEVEVKVGAKVESVERGNTISIQYSELQETLGNLTRVERSLTCDYLIIATPLYYDAISPFLKNMSTLEKELLKMVRYDPFIVTTYQVEGVDNFFAATFMVPETDFYEPFVITKQFDDNNLLSIYTRTQYDDEINKDEILDNNKKFIKKACGVELPDYYTYSEFPYFPHVKHDEMLDKKFYQQFEKMQGEQNTYYVGGLMNFELVETIMNYSKYLVKNNFPKV